MSRSKGSLKEFKTLLPYLADYKKQYILGLICLIIVDAAQIAIPQFIRVAVDLISSGTFRWRQIIILSILMVLTMALVSAGRFLWRYFIHGSSRRIEAKLREDIFDHLQKLSWDFYQKNKLGDLMARSIHDLHAVRMSIGMGLVAFFDFIFMSTAILIIIFVQDASSALVSIAPLPLITILILVFGSLVGKRFRRAHEAYSKLSDSVQETFAGIRVVKSFVKENWFLKKFADSNDDYRKANMDLVRLFGFFFPFVQFLSGLTMLIMLVIGGRRVILGLMSPGSLVAMFRYLGMLIWPLMGAGFTVNMIQRGAVSLKRVNEILNTEPSIKDRAETQRSGDEEIIDHAAPLRRCVSIKDNKVCLEIKKLNFSYEDKKVLDDISFSLNRGEWLGIMGRTGSGKTTLVKTFMRMLDPPAGTVKVFSLDVHDWHLEDLRKLFAVSPQDSYLFSESIADNIAYGLDTEYNNSMVESMIDFAALRSDLKNFTEGKDTLVGERGLTLSGGQKQRVAIARAAIMESEFLILDDSFSAVDNETEQKILNALKEKRKNKTTIIISHRISTLRYTDKLIVLDKGKISEYGTPASLIKKGGYFSRMAKLQQLEVQGEKNG